MKSPINWALLGLVIERPSYAYELAQRFDRTYEGALSLSSNSHVYTALGALSDRGLIEELEGSRVGRQPKPRYRATAKGLEDYREWLVGQLADDRRRQRLFVLQFAALMRDPPIALAMLDRYEQSCLKEASETPLDSPGVETDDTAGVAGHLLREERRLAVGAKLEWLNYARETLAGARESGR